jgi:hypothetical protein
MTSAEKRREREALDVLADHRKGKISARMRDDLLEALGYERLNKSGRYGNNGGGSRHQIGAKG